MLLNTGQLSTEEVAVRLKVVDDQQATNLTVAQKPILFGGKLYFNEEQWLARMKQRQDGDGGSQSSKSGGNTQRQPRGLRKKQGRLSDSKDGVTSNDKDKCQNCGLFGHWAKDCHKPKAQMHLS